MLIKYRIDNQICIVSLTGNLTKEKVEDTISFPFAVLEDQALKGIVVNFDQVPHIDSFGLGIIAAISQGVKNAGKQFTVCDLNGNVAGLFKMFGLNTIVDYYATEEEAITSMIP